MAESSLAGGGESGSFVSRHAWAPYLLIAAAMLFWSSDIIVVRAARFDIPPVGLVFWQCLVAIVVLFPLIYGKFRAQWPILKRHWKTMVLFGILQAVTGQALLYIGVHNTPAVNAGLLVATMPIVVLVLAWIILRDRINPAPGRCRGAGFGRHHGHRGPGELHDGAGCAVRLGRPVGRMRDLQFFPLYRADEKAHARGAQSVRRVSGDGDVCGGRFVPLLHRRNSSDARAG